MGEARRHPPLLALGYSEAAMLLAGPHGARVEAVISIQGTHEYAVDAPSVARRLVLRFDDIDVIDFRDPERAEAAWARRKWAEEVGRGQTPPTVEDARKIIDFAAGLAGINGTVLCQCQAGVSRSPAAALLCLATWMGEGQEAACVERLLRLRPSAVPLRDLVEFGDTLLGRGGKLVRAAMDARKKG